jgi:transposase-like protein
MTIQHSLRRKHTAQFKVQVALEVIKEEKTLREICSQFSIHPTQARRWKEKALEGLEVIFSNGIKSELRQKNELIEQLYQQVGQLKVETDFLKKKMGLIE